MQDFPFEDDVDDNADYDDDYEEDWFDEALGDCAMMYDGQCGHAGSEHCEFVCPIRKMYESGAWDDLDEIDDEELPED